MGPTLPGVLPDAALTLLPVTRPHTTRWKNRQRARIGNSQKSQPAWPVNIGRDFNHTTSQGNVNQEDSDKAFYTHPPGKNEDVWAIPCVSEAEGQHCRLGEWHVARSLQKSGPSSYPVPSNSIPQHTPQRSTHVGPGRRAQGGPRWHCDSRCSETTQTPLNQGMGAQMGSIHHS